MGRGQWSARLSGLQNDVKSWPMKPWNMVWNQPTRFATEASLYSIEGLTASQVEDSLWVFHFWKICVPSVVRTSLLLESHWTAEPRIVLVHAGVLRLSGVFR